MNKQQQLLYITNLEVKELQSKKIRAVTAFWNGVTACISFYFNGEISEEDTEAASDVCGEIIAHFPDCLLQEHYIQLNYPKPIPEAKFIAFLNEPQN